MKMGDKVSIAACPDYEKETVRAALMAAAEPLGGFDWVKSGMKIAVKANLVAKLGPEKGAVTHPVLVTELCRLLIERGAEVTVGDSPGGLFDAAWLSGIYSGTGMRAVTETGARLNSDFEIKQVSFPEANTAKTFSFTSWLDKHDAVINFAKLKTHAMTGMSCAVKNFFGVIPGVHKTEFHYTYPKTEAFCDMLVDLNEYIKPKMTFVDAVLCMEGNGPTAGTPRHMGALIAAETSYAADLLCARLINIKNEAARTVAAQIRRGLSPERLEDLELFGDPEPFVIEDFQKMPSAADVTFAGSSRLKHIFIEKFLAPCPQVDKSQCIGCGKCTEVCPAKAVRLKYKKAVINRSACIHCFCCQEFCPKGAITVRRPLIARLMTK